MDIWDKEKRSEIMKSVKQKDTKPEIIIRKNLFSQGFRFRKNVKYLPGSPDIVLPKYKVAIFVHGCFWHGHECKKGRRPSSNVEYWDNKIAENIRRDSKKIEQLKNLNWNVIVIWDCELTTLEKRESRLNLLVQEIEKGYK